MSSSDAIELSPLIEYVSYGIILFSISVAGPLVVYSGAPGSICAFWRLLLSSIVFLPFWLRNKGFHILQLIAGFFLAYHFVFWMESLYLLPIGISTVIVVAYPVWSLFIDKFLFGEIIGTRQVIGLIGALTGIILYFYPSIGGILSVRGLILSLVASVFATLYFSIGRYIRKYKGFSLGTYVFPVYFSAMLYIIPYILYNELELINYSLKTYLAFLGLAFIPMIGGHALINYLLKYVKTSKVTSIALGEPVGASIISFMVFNQVLSVQQIVLMIIIIASLIIILSEKS
jgi:drug/metabolite transporter (DMT)-like permease